MAKSDFFSFAEGASRLWTTTRYRYPGAVDEEPLVVQAELQPPQRPHHIPTLNRQLLEELRRPAEEAPQ